MQRYPGTRAVFLADGDAPTVGETFRQPDLARTLEALAREGFDGFYRGKVAARLIAGVKAEGGAWTAEEVAAYQVREREPIRFCYRHWNIVTAPPPSSGGVALAQILQMLEGWDLGTLEGPQRAHLIVEAMRRAYRDRTFYLGDPDFVNVPVARLRRRRLRGRPARLDSSATRDPECVVLRPAGTSETPRPRTSRSSTPRAIGRRDPDGKPHLQAPA